MALKDLVTIKPNSATANDPDPDYTGSATVEELLAEVSPVHGQEKFRGKQIQADIEWIVEVRYREDLNATDRVDVVGGPYNGRILNIESLVPVRREAEPMMLELHCKELL